jgi:hypothetical protein
VSLATQGRKEISGHKEMLGLLVFKARRASLARKALRVSKARPVSP